MAKTFDQAIYDKSAHDLYSARNAKFDELEDLILQINELKKDENLDSQLLKFLTWLKHPEHKKIGDSHR